MNANDLEELNTRFGLPGMAQIVAGNGGLPKIQIEAAACSAEIYLQGAHVTSWHPAGQEDVIFLSPKAVWQDGKAIRGGIPVCFPWFRSKADNPKAPAHGFARTRPWQIDAITQETGTEEPGTVTATLSISEDEASLVWWPHRFRAVLSVSAGKELRLALTVTNTDATPFRFEEALHTYHKVGDAASVSVHGLDGVGYLDNTDGNREKRQSGDIHFSGAIDSAYLNTGHAIEIADSALSRRIHIEKERSQTTIVWNPWADGAEAMADLGDAWRQMACVEASNILANAITLNPGEEHTMGVTIRVSAGLG
jgi:glucose-6-phosphate 1-epimerase